MPVQTSCPGCGGPLYVEERGGMAVCQFCGTRFKVNMDGTAPQLAKDEAPVQPTEMPLEKTPGPAQEEWRPPQPEPPGAPYTPPPAYQPAPGPASPANQLFGGKLWLVIALVVGAIVIGSCLCIAAAYQIITGVGAGFGF